MKFLKDVHHYQIYQIYLDGNSFIVQTRNKYLIIAYHQSFELSLGGFFKNQYTYFNEGVPDQIGLKELIYIPDTSNWNSNPNENEQLEISLYEENLIKERRRKLSRQIMFKILSGKYFEE